MIESVRTTQREKWWKPQIMVTYKERQWGHLLSWNMIEKRQKIGVGMKKLKKPSSEKSWREKQTDELHKPIGRDFSRRCVIVNHINEIWSADLVDMQQFSKGNKGHKYLPMVIVVFSKYGWIKPWKIKKVKLIKAFKTIFKEGKQLLSIGWQGWGVSNKHLNELLDKHDISIYSTENEEKSGVVERWNGTIKQNVETVYNSR